MARPDFSSFWIRRRMCKCLMVSDYCCPWTFAIAFANALSTFKVDIFGKGEMGKRREGGEPSDNSLTRRNNEAQILPFNSDFLWGRGIHSVRAFPFGSSKSFCVALCGGSSFHLQWLGQSISVVIEIKFSSNFKFYLNSYTQFWVIDWQKFKTKRFNVVNRMFIDE